MKRMSLNVCAALAVMSTLTWAGCGRSGLPETATVHGRITHQGNPVAEAKIMFQPDQGRPATAVTGPDGAYRLTTFNDGDGAVLGPHRVTIQATRITGPEQPRSFEEEMKNVGQSTGTPSVEWLVPEEYARIDSTPLKAEVHRGDNEVNFEL